MVTGQGCSDFDEEKDQAIETELELKNSESDSGPPVDGGKDAWLCLLGGFLFEINAWGFPFSFGVLNDYYTSTEPFMEDASNASIIGSCCIGIMYLASPIFLIIFQRWPFFCKHSSSIGLVIVCSGILGSSFATKVWHLIIAHGVIYAIGACLLYYPVLIYLDEWFVRRKGLAYGVCWAGTGIAGVAFPICMKMALIRFSFPTAMRAWAIITAVSAGSVIPFVKARRGQLSDDDGKPKPFDFKFLLSRKFLVFQSGNIISGLGFSIPSLYLPTYARVVTGASSIGSIVPTMALNGGMAVGLLTIGNMTDYFQVTNILGMTTLFTAVAIFVAWGLSVSIAAVNIFAVLYGLFAGSSSIIWTGMVQEMRKTNKSTPMGLTVGLMSAGRGIGCIACGPVCESLLSQNWPLSGSTTGYSTPYGVLIIFTGVTSAFTGLGFIARKVGFI